MLNVGKWHTAAQGICGSLSAAWRKLTLHTPGASVGQPTETCLGSSLGWGGAVRGKMRWFLNKK